MTTDRKGTDDVSGAASPLLQREAEGPDHEGHVTRQPSTPAGTPAVGDASEPCAAGEDVEACRHPNADAGVEDDPEPEWDDDPDPDPDAVAAPPAVIADFAAACARFVATRYGAALDFTSDTLSLLDQWVRDLRGEASAAPEVVELVQSAAGAYWGEVARRRFGGQWVAQGDPSSWRLCLSRVYCAFNPVGLVREALLLASADGWGAHFALDPAEREAVEARLEALPFADDDEFYAPTTRFDVLCIVVDALRDGLRARGLDGVRFDAGDYTR